MASVTVLCRNERCGTSYSLSEDEAGLDPRCRRCGSRLSRVTITDPTITPAPNYLGMETDIEVPTMGGVAPFADRYLILRPLGKGGMGEISLAFDTQLGREVALKIPKDDRVLDRATRSRFRREAQAAAALQHPNICPIFDIGEYQGRPYFTMAYIPGETLSDVLKREGPFDPRRAGEIVRALAQAMAVAHSRDIIHRDLKPANVMVAPDGQMILVDFGLARRLDHADSRVTVTGDLVGTPWYMAPEQVDGEDDDVSPRADIYSLGVILYELLTNRLPFEGRIQRVLVQIQIGTPPRPSVYRPDLPPLLEAICLKAIARRPADRFPTMTALADALDAYLLNAPIPPDVLDYLASNDETVMG